MAKRKRTVKPTLVQEKPTSEAAKWVVASTLSAWKDNPRLNSHAIDGVARAIERFGFGAPIVARSEDLEVIAGHTRLLACAFLSRHQWDDDAGKWATRTEPWKLKDAPGPGMIPVRLMSLDEAEAHAYAIADNRLGEDAEWNPLILEALSDDGLDLDAVGFTDEEIADLTEDKVAPKPGGYGGGTKPASMERRSTVTLAIDVEDVAAIEEALDEIALRGETRGQALARICRKAKDDSGW